MAARGPLFDRPVPTGCDARDARPDREHGRVLSSRVAGPKSRISGGAHGPVTMNGVRPPVNRPPAYSIASLPHPALRTKRHDRSPAIFRPAGGNWPGENGPRGE